MSTGDQPPEPRATGPDGGPVVAQAPAPADSFIWERLDRPPQGSRASLNHRQIAKVAIDIADKDGLSAVSMRRLADALGVSPMALYRYVSGKDDILELMLDELSAIELPTGPDIGWRTVFRSLAEGLRAVGLRHPWMTQLSAQLPHVLTPNMLDTMERALRSIEGLGLDVDNMSAAVTTVGAFVRGSLAAEVAQAQFQTRNGQVTEEEFRQAFAPRVKWLVGSGRYPALTRYIIEGSNEDDAQWQFEFGLECVLDGIAARLRI